MESPANLPRRSLMPILVCLGMIFTAETTVAQCPNRGTVVDDEVSNSKGRPYQAKEIRTIVTYGSDGTKRVVVTKSKLFRDSRGRIRVERFYDGTGDPSEIVPTDIWIDDNSGTSVSLLPTWQTAKISNWISPVKVSDRPCCQEIDLKNPPYTGPEGTFEDLGHKLIDGVEVRGARTSYYSSVQAKLSGASPVRVYENWCSISLDTRMGDYVLDDKPKREITTVISDIRQIEPDSELFEIPEGYKITRADQSAPASSAKGSRSGTSAAQ
ncbi:MAG TPA: hypothetical protein VIH67_13240 [Candidatus Acidoferrum sp.]